MCQWVRRGLWAGIVSRPLLLIDNPPKEHTKDTRPQDGDDQDESMCVLCICECVNMRVCMYGHTSSSSTACHVSSSTRDLSYTSVRSGSE